MAAYPRAAAALAAGPAAALAVALDVTSGAALCRAEAVLVVATVRTSRLLEAVSCLAEDLEVKPVATLKAARHPVELLDYSECHLVPSAEEMGRQAALLLTACKAHLAALASAPHLAKAILALVLAAALAVARRPSLPLLCARHLRKYYRTIQRDRGWRRFSAKLCMLARTNRTYSRLLPSSCVLWPQAEK